jgi:hypothetical protein
MSEAEDLDPFLLNLCRQLVDAGDQRLIDVSEDDDDDDDYTNSSLEDDDIKRVQDRTELSLKYLPLSEYSQDELQLLSKSLGKSNLRYLEIEAVIGLDWDMILTHQNCTLDEVCVTIQSAHAFEDFAKNLCYNTSLSSLELDYCYPDENDDDDDDKREEEDKENNIDNPSLDIHEKFLKGLMPLTRVVLRGISPQISSTSSTLFDYQGRVMMPCSWQYLTIEDCILTGDNTAWLPCCIKNLHKLVLTNCQLSVATIKVLSEAYLSMSTTADHQNSSRKSNGEVKKLRKNPLQVLDLSNNEWLLSSEEGEDEGSLVNNNDENEGFDDCIRPLEPRPILPSPSSCMTFLSSWLDSLSNLVELNISNSPEIFSNSGMFDLCGTVNQSVRRLSIRHCGLIPSDLQHMVDTFCWLEALDLSENSALASDLLPLTQLENLTEIVMENMFERNINEFERLICSENIGEDTEEKGLNNFLVELLSEESASFRNDQRRRPLERLNLSGNTITKKTLGILSMFTSLKVLILVGCQIEGEGIIELLGGAIPSNQRQASSLREIYLASNIIGDVGALTLTRSMKEQYLPSLKVLHMESNVISVDAFRVFVEDGLVHSRRLESVEVWNDGAITSSQQDDWNELEQIMQHYLLLNQAGRFALFVDGDRDVDDKGNDGIRMNHNIDTNGRNSINDKKVNTNLWPIILEDADLVYGADALYYFLHKRPDLILAPQQLPQKEDKNGVVSLKATPRASSPKSVADVAALFFQS